MTFRSFFSQCAISSILTIRQMSGGIQPKEGKVRHLQIDAGDCVWGSVVVVVVVGGGRGQASLVNSGRLSIFSSVMCSPLSLGWRAELCREAQEQWGSMTTTSSVSLYLL